MLFDSYESVELSVATSYWTDCSVFRGEDNIDVVDDDDDVAIVVIVDDDDDGDSGDVVCHGNYYI